MGLPFIERVADSVAAYFLTADKNLDARWIIRYSAPSDCRENAPPIWIGPRPRGFDQHGMSNGPRHLQRFFPTTRLFHQQSDDVLNAFTIADDLFSEGLAYSIQGCGELLADANIFQPRPTDAAGKQQHRVVGGSIAIDRHAIERLITRLGAEKPLAHVELASTSVNKYTSMVASCGWIMPAPFAIPNNVTSFDPVPKRADAIFGRVSVVMMA